MKPPLLTLCRSGKTLALAWAIGAAGLVIAVAGCPAQDAIRQLTQARIAGNEAGAIGTLRAIVSAEITYSTYNNFAYGTLECMAAPKRCNPEDPGLPHLDPETARAREKHGYRLEFHAGPPSASAAGRADGASLEGFAVVATPVTPGETGNRRFCVDSRAEVCTLDAAATVAGGQCPASCVPLK
jgi:hypothetical protein